MQIYSDRVTPQDSHAPIGRVMLPQQTNGQQSVTANFQQQQPKQQQNNNVNNQTSSSATLPAGIPALTLQHNRQLSPAIRTSTTVDPLLTQLTVPSVTSSNTLNLNNAASTIVTNHQQQQLTKFVSY